MSDLSPILALLAETRALTLATLDPDGLPRATPLFFAFDDDARLIFLSDRDTQHCRNLERDPRAAAALYPQVHDWRELRGLQIKGLAAPIAASERDVALALFGARFPFTELLTAAVSRSEVYRLRPRWVRLIDNRIHFGYKREWELG